MREARGGSLGWWWWGCGSGVKGGRCGGVGDRRWWEIGGGWGAVVLDKACHRCRTMCLSVVARYAWRLESDLVGLILWLSGWHGITYQRRVEQIKCVMLVCWVLRSQLYPALDCV